MINPNKLVTSKNCLSEFDVDLIFEKASENYSFSVLLGLRNYSQTIQALDKHKVVNVLPVGQFFKIFYKNSIFFKV